MVNKCVHLLLNNSWATYSYILHFASCGLWISNHVSIFKNVKLSLCLINYALRDEGVWGSGCIDSHFLDLGTSWRWVVSFTPRPLYPREKSPRYPLDRRLGGLQSRSGRFGEGKIFDPTGTRTPTPSIVQPVASRYTDYATPAPRFSISV
jgi:hypothetical protein